MPGIQNPKRTPVEPRCFYVNLGLRAVNPNCSGVFPQKEFLDALCFHLFQAVVQIDMTFGIPIDAVAPQAMAR